MTDETRPDQDTPEPGFVPEQTAEGGPEHGWLPPLPDSAYPEEAVPLYPPETEDVPEDEAALLVENPDQPSPYGEGVVQENGL